MYDLSKIPEHMTRPPKNIQFSHWLKTREFIEAIYARDCEEAKRRGEDPDRVVPVSRMALIRAILDLDSDHIVGAFNWNGTWWIHRDNVLRFKPNDH